MHDRSGLDRRMFLRLSGLAGMAGVPGVASATPGREPGPKPKEWIVGVSVSTDGTQSEVETHLPGEASVVHENGTLGYAAIELPDDENTCARTHQSLSKAIKDTGPVKYVEKNETYNAQFRPNDPQFDEQYAAEEINAPTAWEETLGSSDVTIAVVDQGVKYDHPDLEQNMASDRGRDFLGNDSDPYPKSLSKEPHGTHVAGIAAASVDNNSGVSGVGNSTILSARALNGSGWGAVSDIADAIEWSADQGADVINLSLGGGGHSQTMKNAVSYATSKGALVVVAAGNSGRNKTSYPAGYDECLAVSALNPDGSLAQYSNYSDKIELAAPGTNVLSTWTDDGYKSASGTSMASPVVAGVAGLTLAKWDLTNEELRTHLRNTASDIGLQSEQQGAGRIDAGKAVTTRPGSSSGSDSGSGSDSDSGSGSDSGSSSDSDSASDSDSNSGRENIDFITTEVDHSLQNHRDTDYISYTWGYEDPSKIVLRLSGPSDADFDLYVTEGKDSFPTSDQYDFSSRSNNSHETITIEDPDVSNELYVSIDAFSGGGHYTLSFAEYA